MNKIVSGHQPNYLPYLGFFDKIKKSDVFFILDEAQFSNGDFHNRNKIKASTPLGYTWLTIPVEKKKIPINKIKIKNEIKRSDKSWYEDHLIKIEDAYYKAPFFNDYFPELRKFYETKRETLFDFNMPIINFLLGAFNIKKEIVIASELGIKTLSTQRLVDICKVLGADTYLSGDGGRNYIDEELFKKNNTHLIYQNYHHPKYPQQGDKFLSCMSAIDYLFNCGGSL
ncbi:hypothetical protein AUJ83_01470 [Candidatus Woesearchaeota archaeon CG1_02_33_12]|nr:MAG: hypothetical protein AUJ83_01470 [Candidatus Woesearchaeota archaeon CG1_02_33_12]PIU72626.1 MAG: hypothetical protein COS79_01945 [Candidatus Woesearchaeota archaeon CG06_land_8_20_14_3_00_33_13]